MKANLAKVLALAAVLLIWSAPATAQAACSGTGTCVLNQTNTLQLVGTEVTVTLTHVNGNTVLTFQVTTHVVSNDFRGIRAVGWNGPAASQVPSNYSNTGPKQMDGFGNYETVYEVSPNSAIQQTLTFVFQGVLLTFDDFGLTGGAQSGYQFALHLQYEGDCSGYVGGLAVREPDTDASGCGGTTVPEPASIGLLGMGLVGLFGAAARRRLRR